MKKLLLFTFALFLWTGAWAQTNLAAGKSVSVIYLPAEKESPSSEELAKVTDGNTGTNVLLPNNENDIAAISIDLDGNASTAISAIAVAQDGRHATAYTIYGTNTAPGSYSTKKDLTAAAAGWTVLASTNDDGNAGGDNTVYIKGYSANSNAGFQYIVFVPTARAFGVSLRQIFVYDAYTPVYTLKANEDKYIYNAAQEVKFSILDQVGIPGTISAISFSPATYGYATNTSKPSFTFGADFPKIVDDLNVTVGGNVVTKSFGFLTSTPAVGDIPAIDSETSYIIFSAEKNELHNVWNGYDGDNTSVIQSDFAIAGHNAVLAKNMRYVGFKNSTFNPSKTDMTSLVLDIFVTEPHAKENCHVKAEGCGTIDFPQDLNRGWNHVVLTNFNPSTLTGLTSNTTLFVRIDDAEAENVVIYNLYYSTVSAAKSVTFNNKDAKWENVRVYAWYVDNGNQVVTNAWPGDATDNCAEGNTLTNNGDGTFTWTTTAEPTMIIFNNGSGTQTGNLKFEDGETYNSNGIVGKYGYFIVGDNTSWNVDTDYKMVRNLDQDGEYMFRKISLNAGNKIKIVYSGDGETINTWFPDGSGNEYTVSENGNYNIYFKPTGGVNGWHGGYFYVEKRTYEVEIDGNKATITGTINADNSWNIKTDVGMSTYVDVSGATLETYFSTDNPNALYLYATNEDAAAATNTPNPVFKADTRFYSAPKGVIFTDAPAVSDIPKNAFSGLGSTRKFVINRTIAGNSYVTSFMKHAVTSGNQNMTATLADGLEAYELTAAEAGQLTFTKVTGDLVNDKGYVIHNTTSDPLTMTWDSNSNDQVYIDYANNQDPATVEEIGGVKILGTMQTVITDGSQWILSGGQIMQANGAKITAYRAYFTGVTLPASGKASAVFVDGETTKIGSINANGEIDVENGAVYNLAGQRVAHPTKGIYIVNGKKVIIK